MSFVHLSLSLLWWWQQTVPRHESERGALNVIDVEGAKLEIRMPPVPILFRDTWVAMCNSYHYLLISIFYIFLLPPCHLFFS